MSNYNQFLQTKNTKIKDVGFDISLDKINKKLFDFQRDIVKWAIKKGRAALFADTGLGKTAMQLEWANQIHKYTGGNILILAPLAVSKQTVREGQFFGIDVNICRTQADVKKGINITNYEMIDHFNADSFIGIILDESSIIKSFTGKTTQSLIEKFEYTSYKLCCTATPSPNDYIELGNHSEFLGIMSRTEMLATYFIHDGGDTAKWRLKGHAESKFWEWIASWAMVIKNPRDLGYDGSAYDLPELKIIPIITESAATFMLIPDLALTLTERREARKDSINDRVNQAKEIADKTETALIWCDFNNESELLKNAITGSIEVKGADKPEWKESAMIGFTTGEYKKLVSKPSICGFGMNWQHCNEMIFCGLSDSYEQFYQAIRRCWRFGQTKPVNVYVIISEREMAVLDNIKRKEEQFQRMGYEMVRLISDILKSEITKTTRITTTYNPTKNIEIPKWLRSA